MIEASFEELIHFLATVFPGKDITVGAPLRKCIHIKKREREREDLLINNCHNLRIISSLVPFIYSASQRFADHVPQFSICHLAPCIAKDGEMLEDKIL